MKKYVAFFDLDKTILNDSSGKLYVKYMFRKGKLKWTELFKGVLLNIVHRAGIIDTEKIIKKWALKYTGMPESEIYDRIREWSDDRLDMHFRESILKEIEYHRINNANIVILSAATSHICKAVKDYLNLDDTICTELEIDNGIFTGKIVGTYCHGREKLKRALEYCIRNDYLLDEAYYYGDSLADIYFLERVGNPVCVSPACGLKRMARKRGWRIIKN